MGTTTTVHCDVCKRAIPYAEPMLYVMSKRKAPSVEADVCDWDCLLVFARRHAGRQPGAVVTT